MTSNLHGHLHLPEQVYKYGPLNKISAYIFENKFKMEITFHGTRNLEGQIAANINHSSRLRVELKRVRKLTSNEDMHHFIDKHLINKPASRKDHLIRPEEMKLNSFKSHEACLITKYLEAKSTHDVNLSQSQRAVIFKQDFHTFNHDASFITIDCHTVEYQLNDQLYYGTIMNFVSINNENFCVIKSYEQTPIDFRDRIISRSLIVLLNRFFIEVTLGNKHHLVNFENITRRCILSNYAPEHLPGNDIEKKNFVISPCMDLTEHD